MHFWIFWEALINQIVIDSCNSLSSVKIFFDYLQSLWKCLLSVQWLIIIFQENSKSFFRIYHAFICFMFVNEQYNNAISTSISELFYNLLWSMMVLLFLMINTVTWKKKLKHMTLLSMKGKYFEVWRETFTGYL